MPTRRIYFDLERPVITQSPGFFGRSRKLLGKLWRQLEKDGWTVRTYGEVWLPEEGEPDGS